MLPYALIKRALTPYAFVMRYALCVNQRSAAAGKQESEAALGDAIEPSG